MTGSAVKVWCQVSKVSRFQDWVIYKVSLKAIGVAEPDLPFLHLSFGCQAAGINLGWRDVLTAEAAGTERNILIQFITHRVSLYHQSKGS
jgi:hypothetical protein